MVSWDHVSRPATLDAIQTALKRSRIVALIGPRQCGKTTLARMLLEPESAGYFDLEDLKLDSLTVYCPGTKRYPLADNITVEPLVSLSVRHNFPGS